MANHSIVYSYKLFMKLCEENTVLCKSKYLLDVYRKEKDIKFGKS